PHIDWFTIVGLFLFVYSQAIAPEGMFSHIIPYLLFSLAIYLQEKRIPHLTAAWVMLVAATSLFLAYYEGLTYVALPEVLQMEIYLLPWIGVFLGLRQVINPKHLKYALAI